MADDGTRGARGESPALDEAGLQQLVAEADTGGRKPGGAVARLVLWTAVGWSLFQLWYASPLPFALGIGVLNDTEARSWHLAIGLFLAFLAYPAFRSSSRTRVPAVDWALAIAAGFCAAYIALYANELAQRPGRPTTADVVVASAGLLLVLEATRRAVGWPMAALAVLFIGYIFLGPYMPEAIQHKGASLNRMLSHQWLTTEGVFGVALGVSTAYIFIYVLFGALLDRIGAGNYMMQVSFALLGHLRGGPAKVAVVSSALNGLVSGSSVSNVVSGGIFTIPLMKRAGYGGVKAGAIETSSSVNGQIMPPVMGAAAFLMVEYVGIPYTEIVKHAFLPAVISYISLFYIVHLEALKLDLRPMASGRDRTLGATLAAWGLGVSGTVIAVALVYWAALTLGPLLLGLSLTLTSYALSASRGWVTGVPGFVGHLIDLIQFLLLVGGATVLFRFVPNTYVEGRHALAGGVFVAAGVELAKQVLGWYLVVVPTYGSVFGTFAVMPILMLWVYCVWVVVLLGAVIAAYAPSLRLGFVSRRGTPGWRFDLMLAVIAELRHARAAPRHGLGLLELSAALKADPLEVEPLLDLLIDWGWAGRLDEDGAQRHVLLADPALTPARPMIDRLLLVPSALNRPIRERAGLAELRLSDLLPG